MIDSVDGVGEKLQELKKNTFDKYDAFTVGEVFNMKKNVCPGRTKKFERISRVSAGYVQKVAYITAVTV